MEKKTTTDKTLSFDEIENVVDVETKTIPVPQWKGSVILKALTAEELVAFHEGNLADPVRKRFSGIRLLAITLIDGDEKRIPADKIDGMVTSLRAKNSGVVDSLVGEAMRLNGLSKAKKDELKNDSSEVLTASSPSVLH